MATQNRQPTQQIMTFNCSSQVIAKQHAAKLKLLNGPMQLLGRKVGKDLAEFDKYLINFQKTITPPTVDELVSIAAKRCLQVFQIISRISHRLDCAAQDPGFKF